MISEGAFAHTRLETPTILEGTVVHNKVNIAHGCPPTTANNPTYASTVVFPNAVSYTPVIGVDFQRRQSVHHQCGLAIIHRWSVSAAWCAQEGRGLMKLLKRML